MTRHQALPLAVAGLLALAACGDGTSPATPGPLTLSLTAPDAGDRAMIVTISGPGEIASVESASAGYKVYARGSGGTYRVAVFGTLGTGPALRMQVPDVAKAREYVATVDQVAGADNAVRATTAGYTLSIAP